MKKFLVSVLLLVFVLFASFAQMGNLQIEGKEVFKNDDVIFHEIDDHTWIGTGHLSANESIYLVEGDTKAVLIDAGSRMTDLDKIVASFTKRPVTLILTHVHPDHVGAAKYFPEVYLNPGDTAALKQMMPDYQGKIRYLRDGQILDLGERQLEVVFTPSHTAGSTTFIDKKNGYGFSGDSFGSGNLLLFSGTFSDLIATCVKMSEVMEKEGIARLYPGHYNGRNPETLQRLKDMITLSKDLLSGKVKGEENTGNRFGLSYIVNEYGVRINYGEKSLK